MAKKFMRNLLTVVIDLITLILVEVQAIDTISTSFHNSLSSITPSYPFKLDNNQRTFSIYLEEKIEGCIEEKIPRC